MALLRGTIGAIGVTVVLAGLAGPAHAQQTGQPESVTIPQTATTLEGIPTVRVDSTQQGTTRRVLDKAEGDKNRLKISLVDGQYRWTSRDNRPLQVFESGAYTYLSADPGHYIRFTRLNDRISYEEHVDSPIGVVRYWGDLTVVVRK